MEWWPEMRALYRALVAGVSTLVFAMSPASALTVVGDDGVALTLSRPAARVVTLLPSLAEVVCDLGACNRLVGIDRYTNWPPETANVAVVGGGLDPQLEAILRSRPDLIVMAPSARVIARLRDLGLPVLALEPKRMADLARTYRALGEALGIAEADARFTQLQSDLGVLKRSVDASWLGARVYFEVSDELYAAGPDSFVGELLTSLGFGNAISSGLGPFPKISPEWVVRANPGVLVVSEQTVGRLTQRPGWSGMQAIAEKQVCAMPQAQADALVRPGPRLVSGAQWLVRCINQLKRS
jgi:iron complex transport system substrate-binding protein